MRIWCPLLSFDAVYGKREPIGKFVSCTRECYNMGSIAIKIFETHAKRISPFGRAILRSIGCLFFVEVFPQKGQAGDPRIFLSPDRLGHARTRFASLWPRSSSIPS